MSEISKNPIYINHPLLKSKVIEQRDYQINTVKQIMGKNALVVLPTALGKTIIALFASVLNLEQSEKSRILLVAPTRALVMQHFDSFKRFLGEKIKVGQFDSGMNPIMRSRLLNNSHIIVSTPQIIQNDLRSGYYDLSGFSLLIFDEAHKARKNYAYTQIAKLYHEKCPKMQILGLTASPGKNLEYINLLCRDLFIETIVFKSSDDADVQPYIFPIDTWIQYLDLPDPIVNAQRILEKWLNDLNDFFISKNIFPKKDYVSKMDFLRLMRDLKSIDQYGTQISMGKMSPSKKKNNFEFPLENITELSNPSLIQALNYSNIDILTLFLNCIRGIYLSHMIELLTSQDPRLFKRYIRNLWEKAKGGNKTALKLLKKEEMSLVLEFLKEKLEYPKINKLKEILIQILQNPDSKIIIFTQFREMASIIVKEIELMNRSISHLNSKKERWIPKLLPTRFVGQASKEHDRGLNQKEQKAMIDAFRKNEFNILVATSVAEEGLDIPNVDCVIFYEPVPSEIRTIQRRGRTGRFALGNCYILVAKDTIDEIYLKVSQRKEEEMLRLLKEGSDDILLNEIPRTDDYIEFQALDVDKIIEKYTQTKTEKRIKKEREIIEEVKILQLEDENIAKDVVKEYLGVEDITKEMLSIAELKHSREMQNQKQADFLKNLKKKHSTTILNKIIELLIEHGQKIPESERKELESIMNKRFMQQNQKLLNEEEKTLNWIALECKLEKIKLIEICSEQALPKQKVEKQIYASKKTFILIESSGFVFLNGLFA